MKCILISFLTFFSLTSVSQVADFEGFNLPLDSFNNGGDNSAGFQDGALFFQNSYDTIFGGIWDGFALSTMRNDTTSGFGNQYSAITAGGNASQTYMVAYPPFSGSLSIVPELFIDGQLVWNSLSVTNSTYAYLSMKHGDGFAKKFGGSSGNDPDYFTLQVFLNIGGNSIDTIEVSLADYRSSQNTEDFILDSWLEVDLSTFDTLIHDSSSLQFALQSSDTSFGFINTPTYFCLDKVSYSYLTGYDALAKEYSNYIYNLGTAIEIISESKGKVRFYDLNGGLKRVEEISAGVTKLDLDDRNKGFTILIFENQTEIVSAKMYFQ